MTLRAGMRIPRLIVSVANTTRTTPRSKRPSLRRLRLGRMPAWRSPTPWARGWKIVWFSADDSRAALASTASRIACSTSRRWPRSRSGLPSARNSSIARSQPARLKMK
ncbi:MAG: hypothetical protein DMD79_15930 [Candidatus Rokuibacteriota bacterium]|nr:MAG: hypothetical protein DMD79_15930 [Candidatus Rokubacteria bacterium]